MLEHKITIKANQDNVAKSVHLYYDFIRRIHHPVNAYVSDVSAVYVFKSGQARSHFEEILNTNQIEYVIEKTKP
jgi:hypothetical protein